MARRRLQSTWPWRLQVLLHGRGEQHVAVGAELGRLAVPPRSPRAVGYGPAVSARRIDAVAGCVRSPRGGQALASTLGQHTPALPLQEVVPRAAAREGAGRACWPSAGVAAEQRAHAAVTMPRRRTATARPQQTARSDTASAAPRVGVGLG